MFLLPGDTGETALLRVPAEVTDLGQAQSEGSCYFLGPQFPHLLNGDDTACPVESKDMLSFQESLRAVQRPALLSLCEESDVLRAGTGEEPGSWGTEFQEVFG